ncbi:hypothetical protein BGX24_003865 [Mortierella sp. AD032]|nr:hypothetical protein BGX24_003865 [Mortierella sp. AD032]
MKVSRSGKETDQEEQAAISLRVTTGGTGGSEENAPSTGSTSSTSTSNSNTSGSAGSPSPPSPKPAANSHHTHRPGNTNKNHQNTYYATTFNWMYYASEPAAASAPAASAIGRFGSRSNEDHAGSHSSKSPVTISPSIATAATAAVASHLAGEREAASAAVSSVVDLQGSSSADLSNSDTTVKNHSNNNMETATNANTNSTATSVNDKSNNNNNSNNNNTVKHSYRLENLFPFLSSTSTPITLQTTTAFLTHSFHTTTTATSAFFYRTFSPTYRICTLYRDSWTDGSQLRGLERIGTSFWKLDGVVLMKRSVEQMKDVCGMVRDAYGVKAKTAKAKRAQEEREKLVSEGRRRVEENIRAKEKERKNVVERKRGEEDDGHEGGDGSGGMGGGLD